MDGFTPRRIVETAEAAQANSQPCPYCKMYSTHNADCIYLAHKGMVDAQVEEKEAKETEEVGKEEGIVEAPGPLDTKEIVKVMKKKVE